MNLYRNYSVMIKKRKNLQISKIIEPIIKAHIKFYSLDILLD